MVETKTAAADPEFEEFLQRLKGLRGFDFTAYKRTTLGRRVTKRMQAVKVDSFAHYLDLLEADPHEFTHLFNTILINVTGFFRDQEAWDFFQNQVVPEMLAGKKPGEAIRIWSAGCASGEEAYSAAIVLCEALGPDRYRNDVKIYATDVDEEALALARQGAFSDRQVKDIPPHLVEKYFERVGNVYTFRKDLRRSIIYGRHDLLSDAPISRVDLLVCRNTLMYFNSESQGKILARFYFALNERGVLFLGKAEMLLTHAGMFAPVTLKWRVFRKIASPNYRERLLVMAQAGADELGNHVLDHVRVREAAFELDPVAQVVIDAGGILSLVNARARQLFGISSTDIGRPFQDLELSYRPLELRSLLQTAQGQRSVLNVNDVPWHSPSGEQIWLDVDAMPLLDLNERVIGMKLLFRDVTALKQLRQELENSQNELETSYEELQSTNEELETTNEELQSTIEELETTNEELQSTNEELETMNEELQSTNEELETVNDELRQRTEDYARTNLLLDSILSMLMVGVAVLDNDWNIEIWNRTAEDMWGVRYNEVKGRNFMSLDIGLPVDALRPLIHRSIEADDQQETTLPARNRRGKDISCRITCIPLKRVLGGDSTGTIIVIGEQGVAPK